MLVYAAAVIFGIWGFAVGRYEVFPFNLMHGPFTDLEAFVIGDEHDDTTLLGKIRSDFLDIPERFLHRRTLTLDAGAYQPVIADAALFGDRRAPPTYFSRATSGAYLVYGIMQFAAGRYGAMLVSHDGRLLRHWTFTAPAQTTELNPRKGGFTPDGIVIGNAFNILQAQDFCGKEIWRLENGFFHHSVEPTEDGGIWVLNGFDFELRDAADGGLWQTFSIFDVIAANPELTIFEPRLEVLGWEVKDLATAAHDFPEHEFALPDAFHLNDATPLPAALAPAFPGFEAGDLAVSSRTLNLVFVLRPSTRKVLWYMYGRTSRQHDPDFTADGKIAIFDNRNHQPHTRIVEVDPKTHAIEVLVDGANLSFWNLAHGNFTILPDKSIVFVDQRGRMLHLTTDGEIIFELQNSYNAERSLVLRNVHYLSDEQVAELEAGCG